MRWFPRFCPLKSMNIVVRLGIAGASEPRQSPLRTLARLRWRLAVIGSAQLQRRGQSTSFIIRGFRK
jgi:hypothetical protein